MKKGWKMFWIICLVTVCLGIGFCVAGFAMGATWSMIGAYTPGWISFGNGVNALEQQFTGIQNIEVDASVIELQILTTEDNDGITVELEDDSLSEKMECYKEKNTLVININGEFKIRDMTGIIRIYIPKDQLGEVDIDIDVGTIYVEEILTKQLSVKLDAGEAVIERFDADEVDFECGAGRIEAYGNAEKELELNCGVGEIMVSISGKKEDYNYEIECGVGEVAVGNEVHSGIGSMDKCLQGASKEMAIKCGIGSITVEFD